MQILILVENSGAIGKLVLYKSKAQIFTQQQIDSIQQASKQLYNDSNGVYYWELVG